MVTSNSTLLLQNVLPATDLRHFTANFGHLFQSEILRFLKPRFTWMEKRWQISNTWPRFSTLSLFHAGTHKIHRFELRRTKRYIVFLNVRNWQKDKITREISVFISTENYRIASVFFPFTIRLCFHTNTHLQMWI